MYTLNLELCSMDQIPKKGGKVWESEPLIGI